MNNTDKWNSNNNWSKEPIGPIAFIVLVFLIAIFVIPITTIFLQLVTWETGHLFLLSIPGIIIFSILSKHLYRYFNNIKAKSIKALFLIKTSLLVFIFGMLITYALI